MSKNVAEEVGDKNKKVMSEFAKIEGHIAEAGIVLTEPGIAENATGAGDVIDKLLLKEVSRLPVRKKTEKKEKNKKEVSTAVKTPKRKNYTFSDLDEVTAEFVNMFKDSQNAYSLARAIVAIQGFDQGISDKNLSKVLDVDYSWLKERSGLLDISYEVLGKLEDAKIDLGPAFIKRLSKAKDFKAQMQITEEIISGKSDGGNTEEEKKRDEEGGIAMGKTPLDYNKLPGPLKKFIDEFKPDKVSVYRLIEVCMALAESYKASNRQISELLGVETHWLGHRIPLARVRKESPEAFNKLKEHGKELSQPFLLKISRLKSPEEMLEVAEDFIASGGKPARKKPAKNNKKASKKKGPKVPSKDKSADAAASAQALSSIVAIAEEMNDSALRLGKEAEKVGLLLIDLAKLDPATIKFAFAMSGLNVSDVGKAAEIIGQVLFL